MEIKIKVPQWVDTDDEGICMLFAFIRRLTLQWPNTPLDMYGYDMRRIMDREENDLHLLLNEVIDLKYCKIAKLNREHFVFFCKGWKYGIKEVTISNPRSLMVWAYLTGCSNYNLIEGDHNEGPLHRPPYTPMYAYDREMFAYTQRQNDT